MKNKKQIAEALKVTLADSYTLYLKVQNLHWNVVGADFLMAHQLLEEYYNELFTLNDELAERIRALGFASPGSFKEFLKITNIKEINGKEINCKEALKTVLKDKEIFLKTASKTQEVASKNSDITTEGMMVNIITSLEKQIWMLKSITK